MKCLRASVGVGGLHFFLWQNHFTLYSSLSPSHLMDLGQMALDVSTKVYLFQQPRTQEQHTLQPQDQQQQQRAQYRHAQPRAQWQHAQLQHQQAQRQLVEQLPTCPTGQFRKIFFKTPKVSSARLHAVLHIFVTQTYRSIQ